MGKTVAASLEVLNDISNFPVDEGIGEQQHPIDKIYNQHNRTILQPSKSNNTIIMVRDSFNGAPTSPSRQAPVDSPSPPWKKSLHAYRQKLNSEFPQNGSPVSPQREGLSIPDISTNAKSPSSTSDSPHRIQLALHSSRDDESLTQTGSEGSQSISSSMDEDERLEQELRAISTKSSEASDDYEGEGIETNLESMLEEIPTNKQNVRDDEDLPPWKRKNVRRYSKDEIFDNAEVVKADPITHSPDKNKHEKSPIGESNFPASNSAFNGERGGAAEDEDLLRELRAISMKSGGADRFQNDEEEIFKSQQGKIHSSTAPINKAPQSTEASTNDTIESKVQTESPEKVKSSPKHKNDKTKTEKERSPSKSPSKRSLFSSLRNRFRGDSENESDMEGKPNNHGGGGGDGGGGFTSSQPKTFTGDRGGTAEDEELLRELRAISMKSGSGNRFGDYEDTSKESDRLPRPPSPDQKKITSPVNISGSEVVESNILIPPAVPSNDEFDLTIESLPDAFQSTTWKLRKAGYEMLHSLLTNHCEGKSPDSSIDGNAVLSSLDEIVCKMVKDSNAGALDSALRFAILYADNCVMASNSEQAGKISENVAKGPALASTRPSTSKLTNALLMKLMEVSRDGVTSIHAVIDALMTHGVNSKKPKVVVKSVGLVLDTISAFGAATLPLSIISANVSKILSHANGVVRESGIKIIAEVCSAIGSKEPLSDVISSMKAAQVSQLDSLLSKMSTPSSPRLGLRFQNGSSTSSEDLVAALNAGSAEAEARRLAERPAINLLSKLKETEYKQKMKEAKWSEKAGALDLLISCAGEKPYKLVQPSASVNYNPLISELKQLLGHTHFAVNSKAMAGLAMLAEGVGEKLFSKLRSFLTALLEKSKDKKLTRAVTSCLDSFFGNVLGFSSLLDKEDGLPMMLDEKKQKHILIRKNSLAFLKRCVDRSTKCGDRGSLDSSLAQEVAKLCINKLKDSDSGVRNEAISVLVSLLQHNDNTISDVSHTITRDLETSNPRAYKTIKSKVSENGQASSDGPNGAFHKSSQTIPGRATRVNRIPKGPSSPRKTLTKKGGHKSSPVRKQTVGKASSKMELVADFHIEDDTENLPSLNEAIAFLSGLGIENWDAPEDENGVLLGLKSSNWKFRREAIDTLSRFTKSDKSSVAGDSYVHNVLSFVKEHTKNFKESNFNLCKAVMELFSAITDLRISTNVPVEVWICKYAVQLGVEKIADKKFISVAPPLLERLCEGQQPEIIISLALKAIEPIKSPTPHEGLLIWMKAFCIDFGVNAIGKSVSPLVKWSLAVSSLN